MYFNIKCKCQTIKCKSIEYEICSLTLIDEKNKRNICVNIVVNKCI